MLPPYGAVSHSYSASVWRCRALHITQSSGILAQADPPLCAPQPGDLREFFALIRPLFKQIKQNQHLRPTRFSLLEIYVQAVTLLLPVQSYISLFSRFHYLLICSFIPLKSKENNLHSSEFKLYK